MIPIIFWSAEDTAQVARVDVPLAVAVEEPPAHLDRVEFRRALRAYPLRACGANTENTDRQMAYAKGRRSFGAAGALAAGRGVRAD